MMEGMLDLFLIVSVTLCLSLDPAIHEQILLEVTRHLKPRPYPLGELAARVAGKLTSCHYFFGKTGATLHKSPASCSLAKIPELPWTLHRRKGTSQVTRVTGRAMLYGVRNPLVSHFLFPSSSSSSSSTTAESQQKTSSLSTSEKGPASSSSSSSSLSSPHKQGSGSGPRANKQCWSPPSISKAVVVLPTEVITPNPYT